MRSLNPLVLKFNLTQDWPVFINYSEYKINFHKFQYLNKWIVGYFQQMVGKNRKTLTNLILTELKKRMYIEFDILPCYEKKFIYLETKWQKTADAYAAFKEKQNFGDFVTIAETLRIAIFENQNITKVLAQYADSSYFFEKIINYFNDEENHFLTKTNFLIDILINKLFKNLNTLFLTRLFSLEAFFFEQQKLEIFLSKNYEKLVFLKLNNLLDKYLEDEEAELLNFPDVLVKIENYLCKDKDVLLFFFQLLHTAAIYLQPALIAEALTIIVEQTNNHTKIFQYLQDNLDDFFFFTKIHGLKIQLTGRFQASRSMRSQKRIIRIGQTPQTQKFKNYLLFCAKDASTYAGVLTIKLWVN